MWKPITINTKDCNGWKFWERTIKNFKFRKKIFQIENTFHNRYEYALALTNWCRTFEIYDFWSRINKVTSNSTNSTQSLSDIHTDFNQYQSKHLFFGNLQISYILFLLQKKLQGLHFFHSLNLFLIHIILLYKKPRKYHVTYISIWYFLNM